ncbi:uncharacterized protein [Rutidosis leptorrhynchoides]|uniref:uncharacterized protein n=1 Tax=Rutidosis leptorrhynchoides TaxID=125765 RepID=UPI003A98FCC3
MPVFRLLQKTRIPFSSRPLKDVFRTSPRFSSSCTRYISSFLLLPANQTNTRSCFSKAYSSSSSMSSSSPSKVVQDLLAELEREKQRERDTRKRAGMDTKDIDQEEEEDFMGVMPLIEKLEKEKEKDTKALNMYEERSDSDDEDDDERFEPEALKKNVEVFEKKVNRHKELLKNFKDAETLDDAFKWMNKIDQFEKNHFCLRPEYRVMGELINRLKVAEGKEKFILQQKLNRALRLVEWKEAFDPNNPANYGLIQREQMDEENAGNKKEKAHMRVAEDDKEDDTEDEVFDDMKEKDAILLEKLDAIDKKLEEKLALLDHTFGRKGKALEEEIRDLAEERNALTEKKKRPLYRKGFDARIISISRTQKVTKGGQTTKVSAIVVCGNHHGVVGFAKAKGEKTNNAINKAYEKCFQNLHYVERHEDHTIAHAVQSSFKKTKVYLWPASTRTGVKAGNTVQTILALAGFKNVKCKVIGSRNPNNTVKALFQALNAIETPNDMQEKLGRTVVEKYLL